MALTFALAAGAHPVAHSSSCTRGKEAAGCKLNGTGYYDAATRLIVGFPISPPQKGAATELSIPAAALCAGGGEASLSVKTKAVARIGGSLSFSGKAKIQQIAENGAATVSTANITAKLKITNAKKASLSGKAELTLSDGTKCSKQLPNKLLRVLGG
ncbi:MAG: hypothetical protein WAN93_06935 [Solirubrobacteraceae bacterium]